jgi:hypothetical protein
LHLVLFAWEAGALLLDLPEKEQGTVPATAKRAAGTDVVEMGRDALVWSGFWSLLLN